MLAQAVILCGGLGTRLGALTATTPKPMLTVGDRPFVEHLIQEVSRFGLRRVTLLAGRFGDQVRQAYDGRRIGGVSIDVVIEPGPMGTGGALAYARNAGCLDPGFLVLNGDSWIDANLAEVMLAWSRTRAARPDTLVQLLLHSVPDAARYGTVEHSGGRVTAFREKSPQYAGRPGQINAGVYVLDRCALDPVAPESAPSLETDILPGLVAKDRVSAAAAPEGTFFVDIGLPETLAAAQIDVPRQRTRPALFLDRDGTLNVDHGYTHDPAKLDWTQDAQAAVKLANDRGYYVFVVTNQAGVARGMFDEAAVLRFHRAMQSGLAETGAHLDAIEWCPHHADATVAGYARACRRRKPAPGMIEDLMAAWPVDRARSLLIGDADTDIQAAQAAGIRGLRFRGGSLAALVQENIT